MIRVVSSSTYRRSYCNKIMDISYLKYITMKKTFSIIMLSFIGHLCFSQTINVALNETYTASIMDSLVYAGHNPRLAFDNNTSSAWHPQKYPTQWIAVHFENFVDIDSMSFWYGQAPAGTTTQEIYSTEDSINWTLIETINPYHILGGGSYTHILSNRIESSKGIKVQTTVNPSWVQWKEIMIWGNYTNTCYVTIYDTIAVYDTTFVTIQDTIITEIMDTIFVTVSDTITVTDTLVIDAVLTGIDPPDNINTLKIYPNPAKDHLFINTGDFAKMNGYSLKIIDQLGVVVFETLVKEPLYEVNLSMWSGIGLYFIHIIDDGGETIDVKKIILQ